MIFYPPGTTATATWTDENGKQRRVRFIQEPNGQLVNKFAAEIPKNAKITIHIGREAGNAIMMGDHVDYGQRWKIGQIATIMGKQGANKEAVVTAVLEALAAGQLNNLKDACGNDIDTYGVQAFIRNVHMGHVPSEAIGVAISERLGWSK